MNRKVKQMLLGIILGALGIIVGVALLAVIFSQLNGVSLSYIKQNIDVIFTSGPTQFITGVLIPNFILFYITMKKRDTYYAPGIMIISLVAIIFSLLY